MATEKPDPDGFLARRLTHLFETIHEGKDRPYSPDEVADAINEVTDEQTISGVYIWKLKTGRKDNPTYKHLLALANFFGVPPTYFFPQSETGSQELPVEVTNALRDDQLRDLVLRQAGLSERSLSTISDMVDSARAFDEAHPRRSGGRARPKGGRAKKE